MGRGSFSRAAYESARTTHTREGERATSRGEQTVRKTGKLDPLVDPAEYGVVRPSRIRLEDRPDGLFEVAVGAPVSTEYRLDTTGSMGDNVERALKALPQLCELTASVLPGRDPFYCASIFGDVCDQFVLCRGQFEVLADRMVNQLTLMHPEGGGGDSTEDPQYGIFGAAYLTRAYQQRIGLKTYDFTITDAPAREMIVLDYLKRIFGPEVIEKAIENGHQINLRDLPSTHDAVKDLQKRAHAFCLMVGDGATAHWRRLYGRDHVVTLPKIEHVPHVMATIIGLTEGTLDLKSAQSFLVGANLGVREASRVVEAVSGIPIGAQCALPNFGRQPQKGDVFRAKDDLWPMGADEVAEASASPDATTSPAGDDGGWL